MQSLPNPALPRVGKPTIAPPTLHAHATKPLRACRSQERSQTVLIDTVAAQEAGPSTSKAWEPRLGWRSAAIGAAGFSLVSYDVFGPNSLHFLQDADSYGHALAQTVDPSVRRWLLDGLLSDAAITAGLVSWAFITFSVAFNQSRQATRPAAVMGLSWLSYAFLAGRVRGDPWLIYNLKDYFHRSRPSAIHSTLSFPSGHTCAATFMTATLLFVLVPVVMHSMPPAAAEQRAFLRRLSEAAWPLLGLAWFSTSFGRIMGDAHWASDTLAAGFLALAITSILEQCSAAIINRESADDIAAHAPSLDSGLMSGSGVSVVATEGHVVAEGGMGEQEDVLHEQLPEEVSAS